MKFVLTKTLVGYKIIAQVCTTHTTKEEEHRQLETLRWIYCEDRETDVVIKYTCCNIRTNSWKMWTLYSSQQKNRTIKLIEETQLANGLIFINFLVAHEKVGSHTTLH